MSTAASERPAGAGDFFFAGRSQWKKREPFARAMGRVLPIVSVAPSSLASLPT
jgi:hypothetical protein